MMRSSPVTATATPSATPRPSCDDPKRATEGAHSGRVSLATPAPMHLNSPVPLQVSEPPMTHVGSFQNEISKGDSSGENNETRDKETWDMPPAAHIPKPKASGGSHHREHRYISSPKQVEYSEPLIPRVSSGPVEMDDDPTSKEGLNTPLVSKIQTMWDYCIRTFTTNPFRNIRPEGKEEGRGRTPTRQTSEGGDKKMKDPVGTTQVGLDSREEGVQECVAGRTWWDFPMAMQRFQTLNASQNSDTSYLKDTILRAGIGESFREAKAYEFSKGEVETDSTRNKSVQRKDEKPAVREYEAAPIQKKSESTMLSTVHPEGAKERITEHFISLEGSIPGKAEDGERVDTSKGKQEPVRSNDIESLTIGYIEGNNLKGDCNSHNNKLGTTTGDGHREEEPCWVHRWLASYSAQQEFPETAAANHTENGDTHEDTADDDNCVARWLSSYETAK